MSAEAIVYDRLESETIPVAGAEQQPQQQENLDDPNVQVPEGMERLQVIFKVKKPEDKVDEEESLGLDAASVAYCKNVGKCAHTGKPHCGNPGNCIKIDGEWHDFKAYSAIAQDAKKSTPSPNKRKVATTWEDCKAKDKATCPYHGAAFMRDKFNEIFKKYGVENAEVRIAPWVDSEGEADPSYSMYFNLPKNYDKKKLQKIFNEMMSTVKGVGELNAEDAITHHNEPEDRELTYDIESFDPNIDPNEEMAADLAKEKAQEEAKKKAEEEAAKKKAEEEAKKKAAEEAKKKAAQMKEPPKVEQGADIKTEYPTDAADELAYLMGLMEGFNSSYVGDNIKLKATKALDAYADQMMSLATIEQKAQTTNNPETRAVLERLAKKSRETLKQKLATVEAERENYVNDIKWSMENDLSVTETKLKAHGEMYGKGGLQEQITDLYSSLNNDNRIAYHNANEELSKRIMEEKKKYDACHDLLQKYHDWVVRERDENGRLDRALNILDGKEYMNAESKYLEASNKLFVDLVESRNRLKHAAEVQAEQMKTLGHTATQEDVDSLVASIKSKHLVGEQLEIFKKGMARMPASFVSSMAKGMSYDHWKGGVCFASETSVGNATITTTKKADKYIGITMAHELGHAWLYRHGLSRFLNPKKTVPYGSKEMVDFESPRKIRELTAMFDNEGRELIKTVFGTPKLSVMGKSGNSKKLHEYLSQFDFFKGTNYYYSFNKTTEQNVATKAFWILSDMLGCANRGGFSGHTNKNYASEFGRSHEMLAQGIAALTGNVPLIERFFPKSLAKLREYVANDAANA